MRTYYVAGRAPAFWKPLVVVGVATALLLLAQVAGTVTAAHPFWYNLGLMVAYVAVVGLTAHWYVRSAPLTAIETPLSPAQVSRACQEYAVRQAAAAQRRPPQADESYGRRGVTVGGHQPQHSTGAPSGPPNQGSAGAPRPRTPYARGNGDDTEREVVRDV